MVPLILLILLFSKFSTFLRPVNHVLVTKYTAIVNTKWQTTPSNIDVTYTMHVFYMTIILILVRKQMQSIHAFLGSLCLPSHVLDFSIVRDILSWYFLETVAVWHDMYKSISDGMITESLFYYFINSRKPASLPTHRYIDIYLLDVETPDTVMRHFPN